jgi:hypothetical protein
MSVAFRSAKGVFRRAKEDKKGERKRHDTFSLRPGEAMQRTLL